MQEKVIGDSQSLIGIMGRNSISKDIQLKKLVLRIQDLASKFQKIHYFHVLHSNNKELDHATNREMSLEPNSLLLNEHVFESDQLP